MRRIHSALLLLLILLGSCSGSEEVTSSGPLQKRKYNKGWHLQLGGEKEEESVANQEGKGLDEKGDGTEGELSASTNPESPIPQEPKMDGEDQECDEIIKTDGERIKAKVTRIGTEKIEYKKCGREDGPTYEILKSNVKSIRYPDGESDEFGSTEEEGDEKSEEEETDDYYVDPEDRKEEDKGEEALEKEESKGNDGTAVIGFIASVLGALITLIGLISNPIAIFLIGLAFSLGGLILSAIGEGGLGTAGTIISIINLGIGLLILILIVAASVL